MQVLAMAPEQVALLPPTERANIMQLVSRLGTIYDINQLKGFVPS